jgi:hypothetical protein
MLQLRGQAHSLFCDSPLLSDLDLKCVCTQLTLIPCCTPRPVKEYFLLSITVLEILVSLHLLLIKF